MRTPGRPTKEINKEEFLKLYMRGLTDVEISKVINHNRNGVSEFRKKLELPDNRDLFTWQKRLSPYKLAQIPEKYRIECYG